MLEGRVMNKMETQLDIRSFFKMYQDLRLLIKRTMTEEQQKIFALQRDRLPLIEEEYGFDSDLGVDHDIRHPDEIEKFSATIIGHSIESDLDRKLLQGVLIRDRYLRKMVRNADNRQGQQPLAVVHDLN